MKSMKLVGLNTKWYRYQKRWTQEVFAERSGFKMAYISTIESGKANLTCQSIDFIADTFDIEVWHLFCEATARKAYQLPRRVDMLKEEDFFEINC